MQSSSIRPQPKADFFRVPLSFNLRKVTLCETINVDENEPTRHELFASLGRQIARKFRNKNCGRAAKGISLIASARVVLNLASRDVK
jgi:hypothetical protein